MELATQQMYLLTPLHSPSPVPLSPNCSLMPQFQATCTSSVMSCHVLFGLPLLLLSARRAPRDGRCVRPTVPTFSSQAKHALKTAPLKSPLVNTSFPPHLLHLKPRRRTGLFANGVLSGRTRWLPRGSLDKRLRSNLGQPAERRRGKRQGVLALTGIVMRGPSLQTITWQQSTSTDVQTRSKHGRRRAAEIGACRRGVRMSPPRC